MNSSLRQYTNSKTFHSTVSIVIILCSIVLGIETLYPEHKAIFDIIDGLFTIFFICEIVVRLLAAGSPWKFFKLWTFERTNGNKKSKIRAEEGGFWNWFDFLIVLLSAISFFSHFVEHPEFLMVSRLFRVLRVMRLLEVSDELKMVEKKIVSIIPTIFSFILLLGVLLYIYSIIGIYLFSHHTYQHADFSDLGSTFLTLFQLMTLDDWSDMMYNASESYGGNWIIKGYFVSFVVLTAIISFNVFVAVLTSQVHEKVIEDKKNTLLKQLEGEINESEEGIHAGFSKILLEIQSLRKEIEELKKK